MERSDPIQEIMPQLKEMGKSNSRGIILAGPPGTGKTMIAKWLASNCDITCILISAEMISANMMSNPALNLQENYPRHY